MRSWHPSFRGSWEPPSATSEPGWVTPDPWSLALGRTVSRSLPPAGRCRHAVTSCRLRPLEIGGCLAQPVQSHVRPQSGVTAKAQKASGLAVSAMLVIAVKATAAGLLLGSADAALLAAVQSHIRLVRNVEGLEVSGTPACRPGAPTQRAFAGAGLIDVQARRAAPCAPARPCLRSRHARSPDGRNAPPVRFRSSP